MFAHVCRYIWRLKSDIGCFTSLFFFEKGISLNLGLTATVRLLSQEAPGICLCHCSHVGTVDMHTNHTWLLHEFWELDLDSHVYIATFYTWSHLPDPPNCINTALTEPLATFILFFLKESSRCCNDYSLFHTRWGTERRELHASPNLPSDVIKWFLPLKSLDIFFSFSLFTKVHSFLSYQMVDLFCFGF